MQAGEAGAAPSSSGSPGGGSLALRPRRGTDVVGPDVDAPLVDFRGIVGVELAEE